MSILVLDESIVKLKAYVFGESGIKVVFGDVGIAIEFGEIVMVSSASGQERKCFRTRIKSTIIYTFVKGIMESLNLLTFLVNDVDRMFLRREHFFFYSEASFKWCTRNVGEVAAQTNVTVPGA